jgi:hypothetical protein
MGEAYEPRSGCPINAARRICHAAQQKSSSVTGSTVRPPDTVELIAAREINQNAGTLRLRSPRSGHEQRQPSTLSETLSYPAPPVRTKSAGWGRTAVISLRSHLSASAAAAAPAVVG